MMWEVNTWWLLTGRIVFLMNLTTRMSTNTEARFIITPVRLAIMLVRVTGLGSPLPEKHDSTKTAKGMSNQML
jgi:hypothetical protein